MRFKLPIFALRGFLRPDFLRIGLVAAAAFLFAASAYAQDATSAQDANGSDAAARDNLPVAQLSQVKIVGFGDSLMAGYKLSSDGAFPQQLEKALDDKGYEVEVINAGVSGDTTTGGLSRIDWSVPDGTDLVILELGANDALRGIEPEITEKNLDDMLARLRQRKIPVILAGMIAPPNMGKAYAEKFNPIYPRLAKKYGVPLYPFFLDGVATHKDLLLDDGMHPNDKGVAVMVSKFLPVAEKSLKALPAAAPDTNGQNGGAAGGQNGGQSPNGGQNKGTSGG